MEKKLAVIRFIKTLFYLVGFPLLFLVTLITSMPLFGQPVYEGYATNGILVVLAMWAICEAIRLCLKLSKNKNATSRSMIVAVLALIIMLLPTYFYDVSQEKKVDEVATEYAQYDVATKNYKYQAGWVRGVTSKNDDLIHELISDYNDCVDFYCDSPRFNPEDTMLTPFYQMKGSAEDSIKGSAGWADATEEQLEKGENLYVYESSIGYVPYTAEDYPDTKKCIFYIEIEDVKEYLATEEQLDAGNSSTAKMLFYYDKEADTYRITDASSGEKEIFFFRPKYMSTDFWGYEVYKGKTYGFNTVFAREIEQLQGYVDAYNTATADGGTADATVTANYTLAMEGDENHYALADLYDLEARLSYQPVMYPLLIARYFIYIFLGIVALSYIVVGYYEDKEYNLRRNGK